MRVVQPLQAAIARLSPGEAIGASFQALLSGLTVLGQDVRDGERLPEAADLYEGSAQDGLLEEKHPPAAPSDAATRFRQLTEALQQVLEEVAGADLTLPALPGETRESAAAALEDDLRCGGTFQLPPGARRLPAEDRLPAAQLRTRAALWSAWYQEFAARLSGQLALSTLRDAMETLLKALLDRTAAASMRPVLDAVTAMKATLSTAHTRVSKSLNASDSRPLPALADAVNAVQEDTVAALRDTLQDLPSLAALGPVFDRPGESEVQPLQERIQQVPERLPYHALDAPPEEVLTPGEDTFDVALRELAAGALAWSLPDRLRSHAQPLRAQVTSTWSEAEQVEDIVRHNLDVAMETLASPPEAVEDEAPEGGPLAERPTPEEAALLAARETATDGLERAIGTLDALARGLYPRWDAFSQAAFDVCQKDWEALLRSIRSEASLVGHVAGFQARLMRRGEEFRQETRKQATQLSSRGQRLLRLGQRQAHELIKKSQTAVGGEADADAHLDTLEILASVGALRAGLPLIYLNACWSSLHGSTRACSG